MCDDFRKRLHTIVTIRHHVRIQRVLSEDPNTTISGQSSTRQQNAIEIAFRWLSDDGPTLNAG